MHQQSNSTAADLHDKPLILAPAAQMQAVLAKKMPAWADICWVEQTASTNTDLLLRARSKPAPPARPWLLGAHLQTAGRGRAGRSWQNAAGDNLMFSCAFDVFLPARQLAAMAPMLGASSCLALRALLAPAQRARLGLKWPNDILWDGRKLAGILIETTRAGMAQSTDHYLLVIGIGINLRGAAALSHALQREITDWQTIRHFCSEDYAVSDLIASCAHAWQRSIGHATACGLADLVQIYAQTDALLGKAIDVLQDGYLRASGIACGIDPQGRLLLRDSAGVRPILMGDISVRVSHDPTA